MYAKWYASPRCAYTNILMNIEIGPFRISMERTNQEAHSDENTVGIVRLLNSALQA